MNEPTEYYHAVRAVDTTDAQDGHAGGGSYVNLWQHVKDGYVIRYVTLEGIEVALPEKCELILVTKDKHFAPGVLRDPANPYTPPTIEAYRAAAAAGPDAMAKLVADAQAAAKAAEAMTPATQTVAEAVLNPPLV